MAAANGGVGGPQRPGNHDGGGTKGRWAASASAGFAERLRMMAVRAGILQSEIRNLKSKAVATLFFVGLPGGRYDGVSNLATSPRPVYER